MKDKAWWHSSVKELLDFFNVVAEQGLTKEQVKKARATHGSNEVLKSKPISIMTLIEEGATEPMVLLLLAVAGLALFFGKVTDASVMIFVVVAYIGIEFINKYRTDRIMMNLCALSAPTTNVMREGKVYDIAVQELVVGDIIIVHEGSLIPADARLISSLGLFLDESSLTGESLPVSKKADILVALDAPLIERHNCLFAGTTVLNGEGVALVVAVGRQSEWGNIAEKVQVAQKEKTLLQESMARLSKISAMFALFISASIPLLGYMRGLNVEEMLLTWLALTFLMIPGQPPLIITMALALASFELARKQIVVKRLRGPEMLGQVTSIVSDKTGTMTESVVEVEKFFLADGKEYEPESLEKQIRESIGLSIPCHSKDPIDSAIREILEIAPSSMQPCELKNFSTAQPWREVIYHHNGTFHAISGRPEEVIAWFMADGEIKKNLEKRVHQEAQAGKRMVAYAMYTDTDHRFVALAVMHDPVRKGVCQALNNLYTAGVTTYMVTGDHPVTAQAIAQQVGILGDVIDGETLKEISEEELMRVLVKGRIFARIDPIQKLRLVRALQSKGEIVGFVGDGINDAPALKAAEVGIAMGQVGTDLAKEVADLILVDDNYVHLPDAIAISRKALDNFRKGLIYYLTAKSILLMVFLIPLTLGIPFPFTHIQIIIIELLMDLASSTIFVTETAEPDNMRKPLLRMTQYLNKTLEFKVVFDSLGFALGIVVIYLNTYAAHNIVMARTAAFVAWLLGHIVLALNLKQDRMPLLKQGLRSNYFAMMWLAGMIFIALGVTHLPFLHRYLNTTYLPLTVWIRIVGIVLLTTCWIEIKKWAFYLKKPNL